MMSSEFGEAQGPIALPKRREPVPMLETAMQHTTIGSCFLHLGTRLFGPGTRIKLRSFLVVA